MRPTSAELAVDSYLARRVWERHLTEPRPKSPGGRWRTAVEASIRKSSASVERVVRVGSVVRGTAVRGYSDFDRFVIFRGQPPNSPLDALGALQGVVSDCISRDIAVRITPPTVSYADPFGLSVIELLPAYEWKGVGFLIPDPFNADAWVPSDPGILVASMDAADFATAYAPLTAREIVQLVKIWKYAKSIPFSSIYLESLVAGNCLEFSSSPTAEIMIKVFETMRSGWAPIAMRWGKREMIIQPAPEDQMPLLPSPRRLAEEWRRIQSASISGAVEDAIRLVGEFVPKRERGLMSGEDWLHHGGGSRAASHRLRRAGVEALEALKPEKRRS